MSRRRGEFEHRTSIFEGAFRAWSHLGGLSPQDLETKTADELDPLNFPIENDARLVNDKHNLKIKDLHPKNPDGSPRRLFPYEPLPRSGLAHPYVQAILSPWLGPDADHDAIQLGLTTLRTWWQHRRKGESGSAIAALSTDKMSGVVEEYTRHFYSLAHCLVVNDKEQPPRTLAAKMKDLAKARNKQGKKRLRDGQATAYIANMAPPMDTLEIMPGMVVGMVEGMSPLEVDNADDSNLTPLERLHAAQRRQLASSGVVGVHDINSVPLVDTKGKCVPGRLDLEGVVNAVNHQANQLAHRGGLGATTTSASEYGDPNTTPVVFVSNNGDIQIAMVIDGITCAHCVKIVETVLRGCNGNKSPIDGLLDAAADRVLNKVLIKIDKSSNAKRIAFEATRNLSMVGYTARPMSMSIVDGDRRATMDLGALSTAFEVVATTEPNDVFDWTVPCTCPDTGVVRDDCQRHSQMNTGLFEAFEEREKQVSAYMAGCGSKYGMPCTCGPNCKCVNCSEHCKSNQVANSMGDLATSQAATSPSLAFPQPYQQYSGVETVGEAGECCGGGGVVSPGNAMRSSSILSFGGRHMSLTSEATFGRAMSGLSALSIDWENMEDFDITVDHSAHINAGGEYPTVEARRSSIRKGAPNSEEGNGGGVQVSFKV